MKTMIVAKAQEASDLTNWAALIGLLGLYVAIVIALVALGRTPLRLSIWSLGERISSGLERVTAIPGWAAAMVGTASFGLLVAGMGFYNDVAWHVGLGRDEVLFTMPHSAIVIGLFTIAASALIGIWMATATKADVGFKIPGLRVPRSAVAMGLIGGLALSGFPMDELWHRQYGIDVTMWSPTHLLMIVGASLSPIASWLALGEAGVKPGERRWYTGIHVAMGALVVLGLSSVQGEFAFGVPQFQQLYHPVLYALAAGFAITAVTLVVQRWWAPLIVAVIGVWVGAGESGTEGVAQARPASLYVVAAIAVALVARFVGTERQLRFAVASGLAVGTFGLAGEWWWSQNGYQPWTEALLPEAVVLAIVAAVAAAILATAFASAIRREPSTIGVPLLALSGIALLVTLALPLPRPGLDARAAIDVERSGDEVTVRAEVTPADAAVDARWFQLIAWQGGGFERADMIATDEPGVYESERAIPATGNWKTLLRLHKGPSMVAIPVWMPADREIDKGEISAVDKTARFAPEQRFLLREARPGPAWFANVVYLVLALIATAWVGAFVYVARSILRTRTAATRTALAAA